MPDIDIDFNDRSKVLEILDHRIAMRIQKDVKVKHNTGVYFQDIPHDPFTNMSTIDYALAETRGYFKIDLLNVSLYQNIKSEKHLIDLMGAETDWSLLEHEEIVDQLFHINGHFSIVNKLKPKNVEQLAAILAIIRPAKRYLTDKDWKTIMQEVWEKPDNNEYFFKKSHAIAYATAIVVQLNQMSEEVSN
jgi:DNA polymerase III alpha subunit